MDVHLELVCKIAPGRMLLCCDGDGCFTCDERFRPYGGPLAMYEDIAGCWICDPEIGWGGPSDCPEHFHWLSDTYDP